LGVIEFTASSVNDLLEQIDGYVIVTVDGNKTIVTSNASIVQFSPPFQIILLKIMALLHL